MRPEPAARVAFAGRVGTGQVGGVNVWAGTPCSSQLGASGRNRTLSRSCLVQKSKTSFPGHGPLRCAPWSFPPGFQNLAGPVPPRQRQPPESSPCLCWVVPLGVLACATHNGNHPARQHTRNRSRIVLATKTTGLCRPLPTANNTEGACGDRCRCCRRGRFSAREGLR